MYSARYKDWFYSTESHSKDKNVQNEGETTGKTEKKHSCPTIL